MRKGAQTLVFESKPVILSHAAIGGKKEGEGPLAAYFDFLGKDAKLSQKTFEKAESKLQELALDTAKRKLGVSYEDIDVLFAGDLLNQCISSSFAARGTSIPFLGLYGACSTMAESLLLADAAFNTGKYVQGFPEYGPERMGAPITAYNRISSERSTVHSNIYFPDYVVVVDETLLSAVDVTAGLKKEGAIVINSSKSPAELRPLLKGYEGRVCTIDAGKISEEELGKNFPNTPMLAAIVRVSGVIGEEEFIKDMEGSFKHKFASKPQVIEGNMRALKRSLEEVQVG